MKVSDAFSSKYLKASDLDEQDITYRIRRYAEAEKMGASDDADEKPVLYFDGEKKGLALNKTNATIIGRIHGQEMDDWVGKEITLYPTMVEFRGDMVEAIRVRLPEKKKVAAPRSEFKSKPVYEPEYDEEGYPIK